MTPKNKKKESKQASKNRREDGSRIPIQLLVDYKSNGSYLFDFCADIGKGGVFIQTEKPLKLNEVIELTFTIPDSKETIQTKGKVIWRQEPTTNENAKPGMGVQFLDFSESNKELLDEFVKRYSYQQSA